MTEKNEIRHLLVRAEKARKNILRPYLSGLGLTLGQGHARILETLLCGDHITQRALADACGVDTATMSRSLDRLEEAGFLTREKSPSCRRSFLICLTPAGVEEAKKVRIGFQFVDERICGSLTDKEAQDLCRCLEAICQSLENCPALTENPGSPRE